jgi:hypothetical protein
MFAAGFALTIAIIILTHGKQEHGVRCDVRDMRGLASADEMEPNPMPFL